MKKAILVPLFCSMFVTSLSSCGSNAGSGKGEEVALPSVFYNRNFCVVAGNWNENGCALIIDEKGKIEIQNVSSHNDFYDIDFNPLPLYKEEDKETKKITYFLPFLVTGQVIDDGYFKNDLEYRFYLRYDDPSYYCAVSRNDRSITTPDKELMEGYM